MTLGTIEDTIPWNVLVALDGSAFAIHGLHVGLTALLFGVRTRQQANVAVPLVFRYARVSELWLNVTQWRECPYCLVYGQTTL